VAAAAAEPRVWAISADNFDAGGEQIFAGVRLDLLREQRDTCALATGCEIARRAPCSGECFRFTAACIVWHEDPVEGMEVARGDPGTGILLQLLEARPFRE
jgi:hypothetical protein